MAFNEVSAEVKNRIFEDREKHAVNPYALKNEDAIRETTNGDHDSLHRPTFVRDVERIMNNPFYNSMYLVALPESTYRTFLK